MFGKIERSKQTTENMDEGYFIITELFLEKLKVISEKD